MAELVSFRRTVGGRDVVFEFEAEGRGGPIKCQAMSESPTKNLHVGITLPADAGVFNVKVQDLPNANALEAKRLSIDVEDFLDIEILKDILAFLVEVIQEWLEKDKEAPVQEEKPAVVEVPKANATVEGDLQDTFQDAATAQSQEELTDGGETTEEV